MARERYLINAGEDTIHSNEIKLVTAKDKRENWWYYHKRQIIPAILVVALLAVFIHSMATKVDPDYTIGLLTSFTMPEEWKKEEAKPLIGNYPEKPFQSRTFAPWEAAVYIR